MRMVRLIGFFVMMVAPVVIAQTAVAPPPKPHGVIAEANAEILKLLKAKLSEGVILNKINATKTPFDTSADAILMLKKAGATDYEINAILTLESGTDTASDAPASTQSAPVDQGPTLEESLNFVVQQLSQQGAVNFSVNEDSDVTRLFYKYTELNSDPGKCALNWNSETKDGYPEDTINRNLVIDFTKLNSVQVRSKEDVLNRGFANIGSKIRVSVSPPISELDINGNDTFMFYDSSLADRVAQALTHAGELCGSKIKEPF